MQVVIQSVCGKPLAMYEAMCAGCEDIQADVYTMLRCHSTSMYMGATIKHAASAVRMYIYTLLIILV